MIKKETKKVRKAIRRGSTENVITDEAQMPDVRRNTKFQLLFVT